MNYTSRFGLEFNPFVKLSRDILIETANYDEVKARLLAATPLTYTGLSGQIVDQFEPKIN